MRDPNETRVLPALGVVRRPGLATFSVERDLVTNAAIERWLCTTSRTMRGWRAGLPQEPATGLTFEEADAYARWCGMRWPTEEEWEAAAAGALASTGLSDVGARGLCQLWEWTSTPMKNGTVVRGGPYRDRREQGGAVAHRSWEDTGGPDVAFRCVIEGEPTVMTRTRPG